MRRFLFIGTTLFALLLLAVARAEAQNVPNPIEDAKEGEWVKYKTQGNMETKMTVTKVDGQKITIETQAYMNGNPMGPAQTATVDLGQKSGPGSGASPPGTGKPKITTESYTAANGKTVSCTVVEVSGSQSWISEEIPVNGLAKSIGPGGQVAMEVVDWGFDGSASGGGGGTSTPPGGGGPGGPGGGPGGPGGGPGGPGGGPGGPGGGPGGPGGGAATITLDGSFDDWANVSTKESDESGDVQDASSDVLEFGAKRQDGKIFFMCKTRGALNPDFNKSMHTIFFFSGQDPKYMILVWSQGGKWYGALFHGDGSETGIFCDVSVSGQGYEVSVKESDLKNVQAPYYVLNSTLTDGGNTPLEFVPDVQAGKQMMKLD